jgi:cyclic pyranopterin phosphate synthase
MNVMPPTRAPKYLRVVLTNACPLQCVYCHHEGDRAAAPRSLSAVDRVRMIDAGVRTGIDKVKLLGGEPLLSRDLPAIVSALRKLHPTLDLSLITSGVAAPERLDEAFDAGLSRANLSVHGWSLEAMAKRRGSPRAHALRQANLDALVARGRPLKLNYVWSDQRDTDDLGSLLAWAAGRNLVVNVLDDLNEELDALKILDVVRALRGAPETSWLEPDPSSLDTIRLRWSDGLVVELKHQQLGQLAPWTACSTCPLRSRCREGIDALRLSNDGVLRTCMDRADIGLPLAPLLGGDDDGIEAAWRGWVAAQRLSLPPRPIQGVRHVSSLIESVHP